MTDKDDILIGEFFEQASKQEIADNGFSERVMSRITPRPNWAYRMWTAVCLIGIVAFIIAMKVPQLLLVYLEVSMRIAMVSPEKILLSLPIIYIALVVTSTILVYRAMARV